MIEQATAPESTSTNATTSNDTTSVPSGGSGQNTESLDKGRGQTAEASQPSRREIRRRAANGPDPTAAVLAAEKGIGKEPPEGATPAEIKKWEAPGYTKMWHEQRRKAFEALATNPDLAENVKHITDQFGDTYKYATNLEQNNAQFRKRYEPIHDMLSQAEAIYTRQGMTLQQGLGQVLATAYDLAQDPDNTLQRLAQWYKPRDAAKVLAGLGQQWGVNLGELAQGQPYVDPVIGTRLQQAEARLQEMQNAQWQNQQATKQQQVNQLVSHITAFENATENGSPKYPYAAELGQDMGHLLATGRAKSLEDAYNMAAQYHPKVMEQRKADAEKKAREEAARRTADAEQAGIAARNVNGRPNGREQRASSMNEAIANANKQVYGRS
jgi:hypothetical protein